MRIAIIDLGTNSVRFDVHQLGTMGSFRTLHRDKVMIRLGQGLFVNGQLDQDAIHRTTHAFSIFKKISDEFSVSRIIAFGTSALREAIDGPKLVSHIKKNTDIDIRIISGTEEATLIALGILSNEKIPKYQVALIDIGGGSTEISVVKNRKLLCCESFPLGTARLQQIFLKQSPPTPDNIEALRHYIRGNLSAGIAGKKWPKTLEAIGSSGTIKILVRIAKKSGGKKHLTANELHLLVKTMSPMTTAELLAIPGMEGKRVDMILAGTILLEECLNVLGAERVVPTYYSLRDGILKEQINLVRKHIKSTIGLHLPDLVEKAKKLGGDEKNLKAVCENAKSLFQRLNAIHKLNQNWSLYLEAAVVLRDIGEAVSLVGHPEHSFYIIKNAKFPFTEDWESEFVAQLCRYHEYHKLDLNTLPFEKDKTRKQVFLKLLALLCIIDALDAVPNTPVTIKKVMITKSDVKISFSKGSSSDLEVFRAESRKALFEQVYKKKLSLRRC